MGSGVRDRPHVLDGVGIGAGSGGVGQGGAGGRGGVLRCFVHLTEQSH